MRLNMLEIYLVLKKSRKMKLYSHPMLCAGLRFMSKWTKQINEIFDNLSDEEFWALLKSAQGDGNDEPCNGSCQGMCPEHDIWSEWEYQDMARDF
jgi:hypothetical protein